MEVQCLSTLQAIAFPWQMVSWAKKNQRLRGRRSIILYIILSIEKPEQFTAGKNYPPHPLSTYPDPSDMIKCFFCSSDESDLSSIKLCPFHSSVHRLGAASSRDNLLPLRMVLNYMEDSTPSEAVNNHCCPEVAERTPWNYCSWCCLHSNDQC